jgi:hypothetical protein
MANKRISQLVPLTATEVQGDDSFAIVDASVLETKKITTAELSSYMSISGSVYALHAVTADTASFVYGSGVYGAITTSLSSSDALRAISASYARTAHSASYAVTASYAATSGTPKESETASFLKYTGINSGTASYAMTAAFSPNATSASYLIYIGSNNGTASYAINARSASISTLALTSNTASYFASPPGMVGSASWADNAINANYATLAGTALFLTYAGGNNGTASYAMATATTPTIMSSFGVTRAHTQTNVLSVLQNVSVVPIDNTAKQTMITAHGTARVPYTASIPADGDATLYIQDRVTGYVTQLESTPLSVIMSPAVDQWDTLTTGSVRMPFSLVGQANMLGYYYVYVSASSNIYIDSARTTSFVIDSKSDKVYSHTTESMQFLTVPDCNITFYDLAGGGPYYGDLATFNATASHLTSKVDVSSQTIVNVRYAWTLSSMREFIASDNPFLTSISAMPDTCSVLSCSNCGLSNIVGNLPQLPLSLSYLDLSWNSYVTFPFTTLPVSTSYFDCSNNVLTSLPTVLQATSLSFFDCSNNSLTSVPTMPSGTRYFYCDNNQITSLANLPNSILTMSCGDNPISTISFLPSQSLKIQCASTNITGFDAMPLSLSYFDVSNNSSFTSSVMADICYRLVANTQKSGTLILTGNGIPDGGTLTNIGTLQSRNWTVTFDT